MNRFQTLLSISTRTALSPVLEDQSASQALRQLIPDAGGEESFMSPRRFPTCEKVARLI